jgi:GNAT superfamily N-acetyltransferase
MSERDTLLPNTPPFTTEEAEPKTWRGLSEPGLLIRHLEELSLNAQPAIETSYLDGWVIRFANGYTKRANSVNPLYTSVTNLDSKISLCESMYAVRKQPTVYKMTTLAEPRDLDDELARRGYREEPGASVQLLPLQTLEVPTQGRVTLSADANEQWLSAYFRLNNVQERYMPVMRHMLQHIAPQKCLAAVYIEGKIAAVGLGVMDRGFLGLFDIVTEPTMRQRGYGHQLMLYLLNWGKANGAGFAYLQVMMSNSPAMYLYEKLGFREVYRYWYRVKW